MPPEAEVALESAFGYLDICLALLIFDFPMWMFFVYRAVSCRSLGYIAVTKEYLWQFCGIHVSW